MYVLFVLFFLFDFWGLWRKLFLVVMIFSPCLFVSSSAGHDCSLRSWRWWCRGDCGWWRWRRSIWCAWWGDRCNGWWWRFAAFPPSCVVAFFFLADCLLDALSGLHFLLVDKQPHGEHQQEDIYWDVEHGGYFGIEYPHAQETYASTKEKGGGKGEEDVF